MDVDGSNVELLTPFNFGDQNYRSNPDWAPDAQHIAFQSQIGGMFQIMVISLRDRSVKQLTSEGVNEDPAWAPDATTSGVHVIANGSEATVRPRLGVRARPSAHACGWRSSGGMVPFAGARSLSTHRASSGARNTHVAPGFATIYNCSFSGETPL